MNKLYAEFYVKLKITKEIVFKSNLLTLVMIKLIT